MKSVEVIIPCTHVCSVNKMYEPRFKKYKGYMHFSGIKLTEEAKNYKNEVTRELEKKNFQLNDYNNEYALIIELIFVLNNRINVRDTDNLEKLTIDAIYNYLGINDANIFEKHTMKVFTNSDTEFIKFRITQSPRKKSEYVI